MDFMNLLRSAELLLYEVVSWLIFYPLTLWRCLTRPTMMIPYAEQELAKPGEEQFLDALSPPIFLFITIMIAHMAQISLMDDTVTFRGALADPRNLLVFRAVAFSMFPLLLALQHVRLAGQRLDRLSLRPMFYSQCYLTVPFVLLLDVALLLGRSPFPFGGLIGFAVFGAGLLWYFVAVMRGFMVHRRISRRRAFAQSVISILLGAVSFSLAIAMSVPMSDIKP